MKRGEKDYRRLAGEMFRRVRTREGWSQEEFGRRIAEHLGIPPIKRQQIARYEAGEEEEEEVPEREVPAYWLLAVKDMTGRSLDVLFDDVDHEGLRAEVFELRAEVLEVRRLRAEVLELRRQLPGRFSNDK